VTPVEEEPVGVRPSGGQLDGVLSSGEQPASVRRSGGQPASHKGTACVAAGAPAAMVAVAPELAAAAAGAPAAMVVVAPDLAAAAAGAPASMVVVAQDLAAAATGVRRGGWIVAIFAITPTGATGGECGSTLARFCATAERGGTRPWPHCPPPGEPIPRRPTDTSTGRGPGGDGVPGTPASVVAATAATAAAAVATVGATCGCGEREGDGGTTMTSEDSGGERSGGIAATGSTPLAHTGDGATRPVSALAAATALLAPTAGAAPVATRAAALGGTFTGKMVAEWAAS